jgi:hypothetical protein
VIKHGTAPFLECSTKGDTRFSPFFAHVNGRSIEAQYQAAKVFENGDTNLHWKLAKGRRAINQEEISILYSRMWNQYILENPALLTVLTSASGLSDIFGQAESPCQATELWCIRNAALHIADAVAQPLLFTN